MFGGFGFPLRGDPGEGILNLPLNIFFRYLNFYQFLLNLGGFFLANLYGFAFNSRFINRNFVLADPFPLLFLFSKIP